jgi:predicted nucleic acid-binding protein
MIFADLAAGQAVFLDANVFVYHFTSDPQFGPACTDLLRRISRQEVSAFSSTHVVAETAHRVMTIEAASKLPRPFAGIARWLNKHPNEVQKLTEFRMAVEAIPNFGVQILIVGTAMVTEGALVSQQTGLLTADALIVAVMRHHGLTNLASEDSDFDRVSGITRYSPI